MGGEKADTEVRPPRMKGVFWSVGLEHGHANQPEHDEAGEGGDDPGFGFRNGQRHGASVKRSAGEATAHSPQFGGDHLFPTAPAASTSQKIPSRVAHY